MTKTSTKKKTIKSLEWSGALFSKSYLPHNQQFRQRQKKTNKSLEWLVELFRSTHIILTATEYFLNNGLRNGQKKICCCWEHFKTTIM